MEGGPVSPFFWGDGPQFRSILLILSYSRGLLPVDGLGLTQWTRALFQIDLGQVYTSYTVPSQISRNECTI